MDVILLSDVDKVGLRGEVGYTRFGVKDVAGQNVDANFRLISGVVNAVFGFPAGATAVSVRLSPAFSALPSTEQVLLLGQVVLSLTGAGEGSVAFTDDSGTLVGVPLPGGRLLDVPATARDYNELIIRP